MYHHKVTNSGFTLIELLVVIAIIGLLASIVFASLVSARLRAKDSRSTDDLHNIETALEFYYEANGEYPPAGNAAPFLATTDTVQLGGVAWSTLAPYLAPYFSTLPTPSDTSNYYYMYAKGTAGTPKKQRFWDASGTFVGCRFVYQGYSLMALLPDQPSYTLNNGFLNPQGGIVMRAAGDVRDYPPGANCTSSGSSIP